MAYLREAAESDVDLLFSWANDPLVRRSSFRSEPIPYEDHVRWFSNVLHDEETLQFIMMDKDVPVGQIRLSIDGDSAEIGYSIAPDFRGRGYGHEILQLIAHKVREDHPRIRRVIAKVKPSNSASKRLFESEGYEMEYSCYVLDAVHGPNGQHAVG